MEIDLNEITESTSKWIGKEVWICDFRRPDLNKKPIRHVPPQKVMVRSNNELPSNKRIYYSSNHFIKLSKAGKPLSTVIPVYDNTGYRSYAGEPLRIFEDEKSCVETYNALADVIIDQLDTRIQSIVQELEKEREAVRKLKQ